MSKKTVDDSSLPSSSDIIYLNVQTGAFFQILQYLGAVKKPVPIGELREKIRVTHSGSVEEFIAELIAKQLIETQQAGDHLLFRITFKGRVQATPMSTIVVP